MQNRLRIGYYTPWNLRFEKSEEADEEVGDLVPHHKPTGPVTDAEMWYEIREDPNSLKPDRAEISPFLFGKDRDSEPEEILSLLRSLDRIDTKDLELLDEYITRLNPESLCFLLEFFELSDEDDMEVDNFMWQVSNTLNKRSYEADPDLVPQAQLSLKLKMLSFDITPDFQLEDFMLSTIDSPQDYKPTISGDLNIFPSDILVLIVSFLDLPSMISLSMTCVGIYHILYLFPRQLLLVRCMNTDKRGYEVEEVVDDAAKGLFAHLTPTASFEYEHMVAHKYVVTDYYIKWIANKPHERKNTTKYESIFAYLGALRIYEEIGIKYKIKQAKITAMQKLRDLDLISREFELIKK